jgi:hypothetical protein
MSQESLRSLVPDSNLFDEGQRNCGTRSWACQHRIVGWAQMLRRGGRGGWGVASTGTSGVGVPVHIFLALRSGGRREKVADPHRDLPVHGVRVIYPAGATEPESVRESGPAKCIVRSATSARTRAATRGLDRADAVWAAKTSALIAELGGVEPDGVVAGMPTAARAAA